MYELIKAAGNSYYIESPAKIGVYLCSNDEAVLIDSGSDKDAGRRVRKILDGNGWRLKAILNTHSNADHIGGNSYLQRQTGCRIFAPGAECSFTRHTFLEPSLLYGGYPPKDLRHKFLLAEESDAEPLGDSVLPEGLEVIPLPGHFLDMVGFRTPDDVIFLADCLSSQETLDKYGVAFIYDVGAYLQTLDMVRGLQARLFIPSHADASEDIIKLVDANISKVHEVSDRICQLCRAPLSSDEVIAGIFRSYSLRISMEQYALVGSTVRSYLSYLKDSGRLEMEMEDSMIRWYAV